MFDALYIGATGMQAQQMNVDTIAGNLVNANTSAYKRARVGFSELVALETARMRQDGMESGPAAAGVFRAGAGVAIAGVSRLFDMGELKKTESALDVAIKGEGFLEVMMPDGSRAYTRGGTLRINRDGLLATTAGHPLKPGIAVSESAQDMSISEDGRVRIKMPGQAAPVELGQLELARFASPGGLQALDDNLYRATEASGDAIVARAGEERAGMLAQGFVEASNVRMVEEMISLMVAQRAYEASVKVVQASDEMLGMINGLRK